MVLCRAWLCTSPLEGNNFEIRDNNKQNKNMTSFLQYDQEETATDIITCLPICIIYCILIIMYNKEVPIYK